MENYTFGHGCAFVGGGSSSYTKKEAAILASTQGFGFIQQNIQKNNVQKTIILGWNVDVISYDEAKMRFTKNPELLNIVESHHKSRNSTVFLIAKETNGVDIIPFNMISKYVKVRIEDLV